jgi:hypothetical protein
MKRFRNRDEGSIMLSKYTRAIGFVILVLIIFTFPAYALRCNQWTDLAAEDRKQTLKGLIRELLDSPKASGWTSMNKSRIEQCLIQQTSQIEIDFNEVCSQGTKAPMDGLDETLLRYGQACAQTVR